MKHLTYNNISTDTIFIPERSRAERVHESICMSALRAEKQDTERADEDGKENRSHSQGGHRGHSQEVEGKEGEEESGES